MKLRHAAMILPALAVIAVAAVVFDMKTSAERVAERIAELNQEIATEKQRISELNAEWSVLDDPARLEQLVGRHNALLGLQPVSTKQLKTIADIPLRIPDHVASNGAVQ